MTNVVDNISNVKVASNEYMTKYSVWRNLQKLLDNDKRLQELYNTISNDLKINMYVKGKSYKLGEVVWYLTESKDMVVILKSMANNNTKYPEENGTSFESNNWETMSTDTDINKTDILDRINLMIAGLIQQHQTQMHKFGELTEDNIDKKLLRKDMSNLNPHRDRGFFPFRSGMLNPNGAILNGGYRYYDNGLLEYDIIFRFGYQGVVKNGGVNYTKLRCNDMEIPQTPTNSRYFLDSDAHSIFTNDSGLTTFQSTIGNMIQENRNDYVNTYFAVLNLPIPFISTDYMVFGQNMMTFKEKDNQRIIGSPDAITFCNKTNKQITALLMQRAEFNDNGHSGLDWGANSGLASNSFRCRLIGRAVANNE